MSMTLSFSSSPTSWWLNWQLWAVVAAFGGFTLGHGVKYLFDRSFTRYQDRRKAVSLALSIRAEMLAIQTQFYLRRCNIISAMQARLHFPSDVNPFTIINKPALTVDAYRAQIGNLGLLPDKLSSNVILQYSLLIALYDSEPAISESVSRMNIDLCAAYLDKWYHSAINIALPTISNLSHFANVAVPSIEIDQETMEEKLRASLAQMSEMAEKHLKKDGQP